MTNPTNAQLLASLADSNGMWARDVVNFPLTLATAGLTQEDCSSEVIEEAHSIDRRALRQLQGRVSAHNAQFEEAPVVVEEFKPAAKRKATGKRAKIFGHSVTAVLRWMGKNDWSFDDAALAVEELGGKMIADVTVKIQLKAGKVGQRGAPANITPSQARQLRAAAQ